jgi:excisionase family DNA binding protein
MRTFSSFDSLLDARLSTKASVADHQACLKRVAVLELQIKELHQQPTHERETYTLEELSKQIGIKPATIRKYITDGKIKGVMPEGTNRWFIPAEEYERVVHIKKTTGGLYRL